MPKYLVLIIVLIPLMLSADLHMSYEVPKAEIGTNSNGKIQINDLPTLYRPGNPHIKYYPVSLLLEPGSVVDDISIEFDGRAASDIELSYVLNHTALSADQIVPTEKNMQIYSENEMYPIQEFKSFNVQQKNGMRILNIHVYPYHYNPVQKELTSFSKFTVNVKTSYNSNVYSNQMRLLFMDDKTKSVVREIIDNDSAISKYESVYNNPPSRSEKILFVSGQSLQPAFTSYMQWKQENGFDTDFISVEDIYATTAGSTNQQKIRNYLSNYYQQSIQSASPLRYVILGGDIHIVPVQGTYGRVGDTRDNGIPNDSYYTNIDGDWNADGDNVIGHPNDQPDLYSEFYIGRLPGDNAQHFQNSFSKIMYYDESIIYTDDVVYLVGELLNPNPLTYGGSYCDDVQTHMPQNFQYWTLYDRENTFSSGAVHEAINGGLGIVNHMGHSNETMVCGLNTGNYMNLENDKYGVLYSQGCYPMALDYALGECIGEQMINSSVSFFSFVGNTRYGWYMPGSVEGASQQFNRTFYQAAYNTATRTLGAANATSKEMLVNEVMNNSVLRWCYYELTLFGDPSITLKAPYNMFPYINLEDYTVSDENMGDNDSIVNPGESVELTMEIVNLPGWNDAEDISVVLRPEGTGLSFSVDSLYWANLSVGQTVSNTNPIVLTVADSVKSGKVLIPVTISARSSNGLFEKDYEMEMQVSMAQADWPYVNSTLHTNVAGTANYNGEENLILFGRSGKLTVLNQGDSFLNQAVSHEAIINNELYSNPAIADFDNDGTDEIVTVSLNGEVNIINSNGDSLYYREINEYVTSNPVIYDFDNDGDLDILVIDIYSNAVIFDYQGNVVSNQINVGVPCYPNPSVADLDDDNIPEIVFCTIDSTLHALNYQGVYAAGFPVKMTNRPMKETLITPYKEIITVDAAGNINYYDNMGNVLRTASPGEALESNVILTDFNGDNYYETCFVSESNVMYVLNSDGSNFMNWPVQLPDRPVFDPVTADINDDGLPEVIVSLDNKEIRIFSQDSSELNVSPILTGEDAKSPVFMHDVDEDDDLEFFIGFDAGIMAIDYKEQSGSLNYWMHPRCNQQRTGSLYGVMPVGNEPNNVNKFTNTVNLPYPNPFNPETEISYSLSEEQKVNISVYNIKGQKVKTLTEKVQDQGEHSITWHGKDDHGKDVSSGVYFFKLNIGKEKFYRKAVLLK